MYRRPLAVLVALLSLGAEPLHAQSGELDGYLARGRELTKAGKADQALPYFSLALELAEAGLGAEDPALVPFIDELAGAQVARENYRDAEPLYQRALRIQERTAAQYQTGIVRTLNKIGKIYEATERPREALDLYRRVIALWAPVLGGDHPDVKAAGGRLASLALRVPVETARREPAKIEPAESDTAPGRPPPVGAAKAERKVVKLVPMPARKPAPKPAAEPPPPVAARAPPAAAQTPPSPAAGGARYAVHLTSIRDPRDAPGEWARLRRLHGGLLADLALRVARADLGATRGIYYRIKGGLLARDEARARCAALTARGVWCAVTGPEAGAESRLAARGAPVTPPAAPPLVADAGAGAAGYRVHLTSIRDPAHAEAEWRRLRRLHGSLLAGLSLTVARVDLGPERGIYYRVQGGELSRQRARSLCAALSARKIWCRVVRPGGGAAAEGSQRLALQRGRRRPARRRGTRRGRPSPRPPLPWRDRGCRRSPFAALFA